MIAQQVVSFVVFAKGHRAAKGMRKTHFLETETEYLNSPDIEILIQSINLISCTVGPGGFEK